MHCNWRPHVACLGAIALTAATAAVTAAAAGAQTTTGRIVGTVTATAAGAPLPNATVGVVGAATPAGAPIGARTGTDGRYAINNLAPGRYVLRATLLGYAPQVDTVVVQGGQTATANFDLRQVSVALEQVVVVGYGTQKRSDLTGAVTSVTPQVERTPIASLEQTLQGTAPGVQVTTASSAPGGGISIRIRGASSITGNGEPLYVVDGFPIENDPSNTGSVTSGGRDNTAPANPLATLNPSDIESIEILKDASATSIYGARGANGVVIITTKRGSTGTTRVTVDAFAGTQSVAKRYDMLNATEFANFANDWYKTQSTNTTGALIFQDPNSFGAGVDWQDQIFRTAPIYNLQLGVTGGSSSGGKNQTRYALSGGTFQQQGVVSGSNFDRLSLRGNLDQMVGDRFHISSNLLVSRVDSRQAPTDGTFNAGAGAVGAALQYLPILPVRKADGTYAFLQNDIPSALTAAGVSTANVPNPVSQAFDVNDRLGDTRVLANAFGEYELLKGLRLRSSLGTDNSNRTRDTYYPRTTLRGAQSNGYANRGQQTVTSFLNENTLSYARQFGDVHDLNAVVGYTRQTQQTAKTGEINSNFVSDITGFDNLGAGSQTGGPTVSSARSRYTMASYLGRVNYTLLGRYLFTATGRRDGSSRFGANSRWGFFPSAALGWRVSEEPWFADRFGAIDQLKLRASYGKAGNPSIQPYQSVTRLAAQQYSFGGTIAPGYYPAGIGNADLTWESTKQSDFGLDYGMWHDRLELSADYYDKRTDNLLLGIDLPSEVGYTTALVNAGSISNRGIELSLTIRPYVGDDKAGSLNWSSTFSFARNRNRVLDLGGPSRIFAAQCITPDISANCPGTAVTVGEPIGEFFGYKTAGIFRDSSDIKAYTPKVSGGISLGQVRIVDVNGDNVIDANDRTVIGDPNPRFTGGWQNSLSYKGFNLTSLLDGSYGGKVLNLNLYRTEGASPGTNISRDRYYNAWNATTNPTGTEPKLGSSPVSVGTDLTDWVLEDGSFLRLRTLTLSHTIPTRFLGAALRSVRTANAYVTAQNLVTITQYSGFNPDVSSLGVGNLNRGIDIGAYPLARTFIFGVNVSY